MICTGTTLTSLEAHPIFSRIKVKLYSFYDVVLQRSSSGPVVIFVNYNKHIKHRDFHLSCNLRQSLSVGSYNFDMQWPTSLSDVAHVCGSKAKITSTLINLVLYFLIMICQLDTPAALFLGKEPPIPIQQEFGGSQSQFWRNEKCPSCLSIRVLLNVPLRRLPKATYCHFIFCQDLIAIRCVIHYPSLTMLSLFAPWSGSAAIELLFLNLGTGWSKWPDSRPDEAPDTHVERWVGRSLGLGALEQR